MAIRDSRLLSPWHRLVSPMVREFLKKGEAPFGIDRALRQLVAVEDAIAGSGLRSFNEAIFLCHIHDINKRSEEPTRENDYYSIPGFNRMQCKQIVETFCSDGILERPLIPGMKSTRTIKITEYGMLVIGELSQMHEEEE